MRIKCLGASGCVTGSCFLLDNGKQYLIDCGLFQGGKQMEALNHKDWGFDPRNIEALFLTHAHIDHCGRIPKLVRDGFKGKIYATLPTVELAKILLLDSAHIQEMEAEWESRKNRRRGKTDVQALYTVKDAERSLSRFEVLPKDERVSLDDDLTFCFRNAGHILGSSILELWCGKGTQSRKIVFTGDLGHRNQLIVQDPHYVVGSDVLFVESTYGNRNHKSFDASRAELLEAILYSYHHNEKVIIPAFAVARTQELLYIIGEFFRKGQIPSMPVYLDSPLAIAATGIFRRMKEFYDEETLALVNEGVDPFSFPQLILSHTAQDSIQINESGGPGIVIAGNGMCTAGRIKHHLKHNLWRKGASIVFVGYQAAGTIGRKIVEGARAVRVFSENLAVRARVFTIGGFSAHADQSDLFEWLSHYENRDVDVYVIHGEEHISASFASLIHQRFGFRSHVPAIGDVIPITLPEARAVPGPSLSESRESALGALLGKADALRRLLEVAPEAMSEDALRAIEDELTQATSRLQEILRKAQ
ncbi:MAG: MBL fold metallo-hydrolase RNA specificity domain-containing protein [Syntrophobacteraceae bacterium]